VFEHTDKCAFVGYHKSMKYCQKNCKWEEIKSSQNLLAKVNINLLIKENSPHCESNPACVYFSQISCQVSSEKI